MEKEDIFLRACSEILMDSQDKHLGRDRVKPVVLYNIESIHDSPNRSLIFKLTMNCTLRENPGMESQQGSNLSISSNLGPYKGFLLYVW